jgi:phage terminase small subunit
LNKEKWKMLKTIPKPPKHLAPATRRWWKSVISRWGLEQRDVTVLSAAAEAWDRMKQASELLAWNGLTYMKEKLKRRTARPEFAIERDSWLAFLRALREPPSAPSGPPALPNMRERNDGKENEASEAEV